MAQPREKGGRVVFIGNIPYGVSEEQICDIFGRIGSVLSFRLVYDKETGKPKGFGFLEYPDVDQAAAAVRNLNNFEIMGRHLKVDYSNDNSGKQQQDTASNRAPPPAHFDMNIPPQNGGGNAEVPPLPQGVEPTPGLTVPDAISQTLQAIPPPQLLDILSQMKNLVATEPAKATAILTQAPQLSYAVFQALMLLGLVDQTIVHSLIIQTQQAPAPAQAPQQMYQQPPLPPQYQQQQQQQQYPPQQYQPFPSQLAQTQQPAYVSTPPTHAQQQPYPPPPQQYQHPQGPPQVQQAPQQQQQQPQDQNELIKRIMTLTPDEIERLPEPQRGQVMTLRAQLAGQFGA